MTSNTHQEIAAFSEKLYPRLDMGNYNLSIGKVGPGLIAILAKEGAIRPTPTEIREKKFPKDYYRIECDNLEVMGIAIDRILIDLNL